MSALFDHGLLQQHVKRARPNWARHDFLHQQTADLIRDRLLDIKRSFSSVLLMGWPTDVLNDVLQQAKQITDIHTLSVMDPNDNGILPITPHTYDAVISHLALHLMDDPALMLKQYLFALKPDGVMMGCLLGGETLHELRTVLADAEQEFYGGYSPRVHPMITVQDVAALMQQTGFALPVVDTERMTVTYASLKNMVADLRGMAQTNSLVQRRRQPVGKRFWNRVEELYRERFVDERGRMLVTFDIIHILGWSPDPSQPQPKARGSATVPLGDLLEKPGRA